jgi:hypothetical protein
MAIPTPPAGDVVLRLRKKRDEEWIWAEFEPANWSLVVQPGSEVGLFQKQIPNPLVANNGFWRGPIYLVFGETNNGLTTWTAFDRVRHVSINRPANFAVSFSFVGRHRIEPKEKSGGCRGSQKMCRIKLVEESKRGKSRSAHIPPAVSLITDLFCSERTREDTHLLYIRGSKYLDADSTARYNG